MLEIVQCPNFKDGAVVGNPCYEILSCQTNNRQVPEPWNSNIETAEILFLSSNPSIGINEKYPYFDDEKKSLSNVWDDKSVMSFFTNRFSKEYPYVKNHLYPQSANDAYMTGWVRFWAAVRSMASIILERPAIPSDDYAIAEIVRCKSHAEKGVEAATNECISRYLNRTIELSAAKIIICLGKKVKLEIKNRYNCIITSERSENNENEIWEMQFNNRKLMLLFLPHPNAREERNISKLFGDKLNLIKNALQ